jgi:hypothetical protein
MAIFSEAQRAGLEELRRRQTYAEAHDLTPAQRIELASTMMRGLSAPVVPGHERPTDEPPEIWLRLMAHFRECGPK